ncbi:unnamed protein product [Lasius platythorax]|uniref:Uncharacterized protein n=1 Tax=Lasius platythorax TaxID=488582 RepID=A0AAV2ND23_9HYME
MDVGRIRRGEEKGFEIDEACLPPDPTSFPSPTIRRHPHPPTLDTSFFADCHQIDEKISRRVLLVVNLSQRRTGHRLNDVSNTAVFYVSDL